MEITDNDSRIRKNVRALALPTLRRNSPPLGGLCYTGHKFRRRLEARRESSFEAIYPLEHPCRLGSCDRVACRLDGRRQLQCQFGDILICSQAIGLRLRISTDLRHVYMSPAFRGPCATSNSFSGTMLLPLRPNIASVRPLPLNPAVLFLVGTIIS
jgi:hypothetical protein